MLIFGLAVLMGQKSKTLPTADLDAEKRAGLIRSMTAEPDTESSVSVAEEQRLINSMSAPPSAPRTPAQDAEREALIRSMSGN